MKRNKSAFKDFTFEDVQKVEKAQLEEFPDWKVRWDLETAEQEKVNQETEATFVKWINHADVSYALYSYIVDGVEHGFAWETYWDEYHRALSGDKKEDPEWYDNFSPGNTFKIKYFDGKPQVHKVLDESMRIEHALFVGER